MSTQTPKPALAEDRVYLAFDRFVCGTTRCAGSTALASGYTIGGARVTPVTVLDVGDWEAAGLGSSITCECGRLETNGRSTVQVK